MQSKYCLCVFCHRCFDRIYILRCLNYDGGLYMEKTTVLQIFSQRRRAGSFLLAVCWLFGVLLGFCAAIFAGNSLSSLMRGSTVGSVSIVRMLVLSSLPFLLSALAVYLSQPWLIFALSFLKAFCFSFCAVGIHLAFGSSGWLVQLLLLFTDCFTIPVLYLYCSKLIQYGVNKADTCFLRCLIYACCVGIVDYCWIAPFLRTVFIR